METKVQRLKRWLCKLLGCEAFFQPTPVVTKNGNLETFQYDGYDMEVHLFPDQVALSMCAFLKGSLVLTLDCSYSGQPEWAYGLHTPSYKTRKYMQEYAQKRLTQLKDNK